MSTRDGLAILIVAGAYLYAKSRAPTGVINSGGIGSQTGGYYTPNNFYAGQSGYQTYEPVSLNAGNYSSGINVINSVPINQSTVTPYNFDNSGYYYIGNADAPGYQSVIDPNQVYGGNTVNPYDFTADANASSASDSEIAFIKHHEGLRLKAYPDAYGYSIGYGHFGATPGQVITEQQANDLLASDVANIENFMNGIIQVPLTQNQYDAVLDLIFNIGTGAFRNSTLLRLLNASDYWGAANQFSRWVNSSGSYNSSLANLRTAEYNLFISDLPGQDASS